MIRFPVLGRKPWERAAEVDTLERRIFVHLSSEEAFPQWAIGNEADSKLLQRRQHILLAIAEPERVFALDSGHRLNDVCTADRVRRGFRHAEVLHLALVNEVLHSSRGVFDRSFGIHAVLIVEIDRIHLEPLERPFDGLLDVLRTAVQPYPARTSIGFELVRELGGDDYFSAERRQRLP